MIPLASAQEQTGPAPAAAEAPKEAQAEEVTITGSRIQLSPGMSTPTPVTSVTQDELVKIAPTQIIDSLSALPQFYNNSTFNAALGGQSPSGEEVNLYGANTSSGISRTLVLLDGRRTVPNSRFGAVDIGQFPDDLIKNVEVVTGGASASYGADAVAGVVNFILDTKFEGVKMTAQGGETARNDGPTYKFALTAGHQFGEKLHVVASLSEFGQDPIDSFASLQSRPYFNQTGLVSGPPGGPNYISEPYVIPTNFSYNGTVVMPGSPINGMQFSPDGRSLLPAPTGIAGFVGDTCNCLATKNETYGVDSQDTVSGGYTRKNAFLHVTYDVTDHLQAYAQGIFSDDSANIRWQSASLLDSWQLPVGLDNPFLTSTVKNQIQSALVSQYPNGPAGPGTRYVYPGQNLLATQYFDYGLYLQNTPGNPLGETRQITANNTKEGTLGFKGDVHGWTIDGFFTQGETIEDYVDYNGTRVDRLFLAADAITGPNGSPMCRVASQQYDPMYYKSFSDCVPINLFGGWNNISPQAADYVSGPTKDAKQYYNMSNGELSATGTLFKGFGAGPVKADFGVDWRKESVYQITPNASDEYPAFLNGQLIGNTIPTNPTYFRGVIPQGFYINQFGYTQPWPAGAPTLTTATAPTLNPASAPSGGIPGLYYVPTGYLGDANSSSIMFSSERTFSGDTVVKEAFTEFQIPLLKDKPFAEGLSLDLAYRYANYSGSGSVAAWKFGVDWAINDDIRLRATRSRDVRAATLEERFDTTRGGVEVLNPYVLTNGASTLQSGAGYSGGNPSLAPEKSDTWTAGIVLTPTFVQGLSVSVDWYQLDIADAIDKPSTQQIVAAAFAGDPQFTPLVKLDSQKNIVEVDQYFINFAEDFVSGIDFEASYRHGSSLLNALLGGNVPESYAVRLLGSDLMKNATLTEFGTYTENAGTAFLPKHKLEGLFNYDYGRYSGFLQARWQSGGLLSTTAIQANVPLSALQNVSPNVVDTVDINHVPSMILMDASLAYDMPFATSDLNLAFEVNNLLDKAPNTFAALIGRAGVSGVGGGDILGRRYTVTARYRF